MDDGTRLFWIVPFSLLGSVGAVTLCGSLLLVRPAVRARLVPPLVSYAAGTLLGAALLGLLPEAMRAARPEALFPVTLAGIAMADLMPHLHQRGRDQRFALQVTLMAAGIGTIVLVRTLSG